mgnify:CR=1 FL=1|tara:strand:+ start:42428 stop:44098 length:1671 start_codon:yes stop_codon:yes gene_type:complete
MSAKNTARLTSFAVLFAAGLAAASCTAEKLEEKGLVDTSVPPQTPLGLGKADGVENMIALQVASEHPYANDMNEEFVIDLEGVVPECTGEVRLHFAALQLEEGYDFLHVVDSEGQIIQSLTGDHGDEFSQWLRVDNQRIVSVVLESDYSITRHGFEIDGVERASNLLCPAFVPPPCAAGEIDINPPRGECECQRMPTCVAVTDVGAQHSIGGGFAGTYSGNRFAGTQAFSTSSTTGDVALGSIDETALRAFMSDAINSGMLYGEDVSNPANVSEEFLLSAGSQDASYVRAAGSFPENEARVIAHFESLFTCGEGEPLSCAAGNACIGGSCVSEEACICPEIFAPVCDVNGQQYSNACKANCASAEIAHEGACGTAGDACGGFQGLQCQPEFRCRFGESQYDFPFPDAMGSCVAEDYCDAPQDCTGLPHIAVPGTWACEQNQCSWDAGSPWTAVPNWSLETSHPYPHNASQWTQLFAPAGARAVRLEILEEFSLEDGYDFLEVWTWSGSSWSQVARFTGDETAGASYEFEGRFHYLHFVSDYSVAAHGFELAASYRQ